MLPVPTLQISHIGEEEEVYKAEIVIHVLGSIRGGKTPSEPQSEAMSPTASCFGDDSVDTLESTTCSLIGSPLELSPRSPFTSSKRVSPRPHPYCLSPRTTATATTTTSFLLPHTLPSSASLSVPRSGQLSPPVQMDTEEARLAEEEKREKRREKDRIRKRIQREKQRREKQSNASSSLQSSSSQAQQSSANAHSMHMMHQMQMQMQMQMHIAPPPHQQAVHSTSSSGSDASSIPLLSSFLAATTPQQQQPPQHHHQMNGTLPPFSISFCN